MFRGIGNYSLDFLRNLIIGCNDFEIVLIVNGSLSMQCVDSLIDEFGGTSDIRIRSWYPVLGTSWLANNLFAREISESVYDQVVKSTNPDLFFLLSPFEGLSEEIIWKKPEGIHSSVIFYDAIPAIFPERYLPSKDVAEWYYFVANKIKTFDRLLAISESSAQDAVHYFNIKAEIIDVIHFGLLNEVVPPRSVEIPGEYVLAVLGEDERKNKVNLLKGWALLASRYPSLKLRIVYKQSEPERQTNSKILKEMNLENSVEFLDFVSENSLSELYSNCLFTVFPSFYEGLGLPVLESFSHAKPCVVSDCSSLPELVANEALRFDPNSPTEIADVFIKLISNNALYVEAVSQGQDVLKKFQFENKQKQINAILQSVLLNGKKTAPAKISGIYLFTILPPVSSGIANYANHLIHEFHTQTNLILVSHQNAKKCHECLECGLAIEVQSPEQIQNSRKPDYVDIHNIGNSEYHVWQIDLLLKYPGIIILHDGYLSGLVWSQHRDGSNTSRFIRVASSEVSNVKFSNSSYFHEPHRLILDEKLDQRILESAIGVIVHSDAARALISESFYIAKPEHLIVIPHFSEIDLDSYDINKREDVVGVFGIVAESKMYKEIISAWSNSQLGKSGRYILRFIGEDLSNDFGRELKISSSNLRIETTGYLNRSDYLEQLNRVKFAIQLRRGFRGETSGALTELLSRGIPVITNISAWIENHPEVEVLSVSEKFASEELSEKIDWVSVNFNQISVDFSEVKSRINAYSNPAKCVSDIISFAHTINTEREYDAANQLKKLLHRYHSSQSKSFNVQEIGDICIRSFPNLFNKKRMLVVLSDTLDPMDENFRNALAELNQVLISTLSEPLFYCRFISSLNSYECLIESVIPSEVAGYFQVENFLIRPRDTDQIISKSTQVEKGSKTFFAISEIKSKIGVWLAE